MMGTYADVQLCYLVINTVGAQSTSIFASTSKECDKLGKMGNDIYLTPVPSQYGR
jgi:hypothetical protein